MSDDYKLPKRIDDYISLLSKLYKISNEVELQSIIVNASIEFDEPSSETDWGEVIYSHCMRLVIPEQIYVTIYNSIAQKEGKIASDLNKISKVQHEHIGEVHIDVGSIADKNWRQSSGLLIKRSPKKRIPDDSIERIWIPNYYRIFITHKAGEKQKATTLKRSLLAYGISSFVAHEDIKPTEEWMQEIENALFSMDAFIALITADFHDSDWTDQEVGVAIGRGVPIISVRLGRDPYGFIGKYQAASFKQENDLAFEIAKILLQKREKMMFAYIWAITKASDIDEGNRIAKLLPYLGKLSKLQIKRIIEAYNKNKQIHRSFGFNGDKPAEYGMGIAFHLTRISGSEYRISRKEPRIISLVEEKTTEFEREVPF